MILTRLNFKVDLGNNFKIFLISDCNPILNYRDVNRKCWLLIELSLRFLTRIYKILATSPTKHHAIFTSLNSNISRLNILDNTASHSTKSQVKHLLRQTKTSRMRILPKPQAQSKDVEVSLRAKKVLRSTKASPFWIRQ